MISINKRLQQSILMSVLSKNHSLDNILNLSRCIYNELNIRISYDYTWLYDKNFMMEDNFDKKVTFSNLINTKISCNSWCQLFKELLLEFGVAESDIYVKSEKLKHKWIEIKLGGYADDKILKIDATTNYFGNQDIYNCKVNNNTSGFLILDKTVQNYSLEQLYNNDQFSVIDIEKQGILYHQLDEVLEFHGIKLFDILKKCINNSSSPEQLIYKTYRILEAFAKTSNNLVINGSDLCKFLKHNLQVEDVNVEFLAYYNYGYIETCCKVTYHNMILFYSENNVVLLNNNDFEKYVSDVKFVKKK